MGVHGLMALVRDRTRTVRLEAFKGHVIAVDGNVWIHKGTYGCALELASGVDSDAFVLYCVRQTNRLRQCGVYPLVVFDGRKLEAKGPEHARRKEARAQAKREFQAQDEVISELEAQAASQHYDGEDDGAPTAQERTLQIMREKNEQEKAARRAVSVSEAMVERVMESLRTLEGVSVMRAPYEADAQLAFLAREQLVHAVLTEDSDLIAYSCPRLLFKFDASQARRPPERAAESAHQSAPLRARRGERAPR